MALEARSDEAFVRGTAAYLASAFGLWGEAYSEATAALAIARATCSIASGRSTRSAARGVPTPSAATRPRREHCTASSSRSPASSARPSGSPTRSDGSAGAVPWR